MFKCLHSTFHRAALLEHTPYHRTHVHVELGYCQERRGARGPQRGDVAEPLKWCTSLA